MLRPLPPTQHPSEDYFAFEGGLDIVTPPMQLDRKFLIECINFDIPAVGGYRRMPGYERFDGRTKPSDAGAVLLPSNAPYPGTVAVGDTLNGQTSGATGKVVYIPADRMYVAVTRVTGAFVDAENIREGVTVVGVLSVMTSTITGDVTNQIAAAAANDYRADITAVPGSGPVRGVVEYNGTVYAVRDNAGGTAAVFHRSTAGGWVAIALNEEVAFSVGSGSVDVGDTLTQGGVTSIIRRVIITSGTLAGGNAVGKFVISGRGGGNYGAGAATTTGGGTCTLGGIQTAQVLPAGGKYRFIKENFGGAVGTRYVYAVNGVTRAFEFDGTYLAFITTGMTDDTPDRLIAHRKHLFLAFGSSVQFSSPGAPHNWSVTVGTAGEIATGSNVNDFMTGPGANGTGALIIGTQEVTYALYGNGSSDWNLQVVAPEVGVRAHSGQVVTQPVFLDKLGITDLASSQNFGNFDNKNIGWRIRPYVGTKLNIANCSAVLRKENQYKIFFSDGSGVTATWKGGKLAGMTPFQLPAIANVAAEHEIGEGGIFIGATDGYVYELNVGRSFDGAVINALMRQAFNFNKSPHVRKRYHRTFYDITASGYASFTLSFWASRNDPDIDAGTASAALSFTGGGAAWDDTGYAWDIEFGWDGNNFTRAGTGLDVVATDVSFLLSSSSDNQLPWTVTGQSLTFRPHRPQRRI